MILASKRATTVLIVDDEPVSLEFAVAIFQRHGCDTWSTQTGSEAVGLARRCRPDLVMLDMQIPGTDGLSLRKQILKSCIGGYEPVFIVLTGETRSAQHEVLLQSAFTRVITKPATAMQLLQCLELVCEQPAPSRLVYDRHDTGGESALRNKAALQALDGDKELLDNLRQSFSHELNRLCPQIDGHLVDGEFPAAAMLVHRLTAAAGYCGAVPLWQCCSFLEAALQSGDTRTIADQYTEFLRQCHRLYYRLES